MSVFDEFLSTPSAVARFGDRSVVQAMLDFEAALAGALAAESIIPEAAAAAIIDCCKAERVDVAAIVAASGRAGSLAIPLVRHLTEAVASVDEKAAAWVHWGSTSQDVIDTALVLCTRAALAALDIELQRMIAACAHLTRAHRATPILARTLMQPAQVVSFGFKSVAWLAPLVRRRVRLQACAQAALRVQCGGAAGTLATLGAKGPAVADRIASTLGLAPSTMCWHTQRDDWVALGCEVGVLCGAAGKIARDIALLSQAEVAEVAEPSGAGRGGSSAMPHKRNPVAAMIGLSAALRAPQAVAGLLAAMPQEQERGLGNWQAELAEWATLWTTAQGALAALAEALEGLQLDPARMRSNIDALLGLPFTEMLAMRIAEQIGKAQAHRFVEALSQRAVAEHAALAKLAIAAIAGDTRLAPHIASAEVERIFDPEAAAQHAASIVERTLQSLAV